MEVYERPVNMFVARFIGSPPINFLPGQIETNGDGQRFTASSGVSIALPQGVAKADWPQDVTVGIRPEDISLNADRENLPAQVLLMEQLGAESILHTAVGENNLVLKLEKNVSYHSGENVNLHLSPAHLHFFDTKTEARLV
jgi:ABC-type sugar transport system ATPase subunit